MVISIIYCITILHLIYFNKMIILFHYFIISLYHYIIISLYHYIIIYNKYLNIYYIIKNEYII